MSDHQDNRIEEEVYSLEDILAEYSVTPPKEQAGPIFLPQSEPPSEEEEEEIELPWQQAHRAPGRPAAAPRLDSQPPEAPSGEEAEPLSPLEQLRRRADDFADQMFQEEGVETSERVTRAETLIPGVDEEEPEPPPSKKRPPRAAPAPPPDLPPAELARRLGKGLGGLHIRWLLVCLLCLPPLWLLLAQPLALPLPPQLAACLPLRCYIATGCLLLCAGIGFDAWLPGLGRLFRGRVGMDTLLAFAVMTTAADAIALTFRLVPDRGGQPPYCGVVCLALACAMRGNYLKRLGLRTACKSAAMAQEPYVVTLDPARWNNRPAYSKHARALHGFGSQVQAEDGAQRLFARVCPVLLIACLVLSLLASVGRERSEYLTWCLSASFTAAAALGGSLVYGKPVRILARRLAACGAALAGWDGVRETGRSILLTDADLFPPGTVTVNGIKVFGDFPLEKVTAVTATLLRDAGSGLDRLFRDLLRAQGGSFRNALELTCYEAGGLSALIREQQILVGSAAFMTLMEVRLPQGLNVKNAVFCAIDGELAGIFALNYSLQGTIPPALDALIRNKLSPVLVTRDFNLIPAMLRQRFKLPVERMEYPNMERRMELSDPEGEHSGVLTAVLCREGLFPMAEAVAGGARLRRAVRLSGTLVCLGSALGVLLSYYLTLHLAFASLSAASLLLFQLMWLVPVELISGWVDHY